MAFGFPTIKRRLFAVTCKRCRRDVPSGRDEFPFQSVAVECPLCGELRRYLPSEVFLGRPDQLVLHQQRHGGRYQTLMLPLLKIAGGGKVHTKRDAVNELAAQFGVSEAGRKELLPSGKQEVFDTEVS